MNALTRIAVATSLAWASVGLHAKGNPFDLTQLRGAALVADTGELVVANTRVRLQGIEALPRDALCDGKPAWRCGEFAQGLLAAFLRGREVECRLSMKLEDVWVGHCSTSGIDVQGFLVTRGLALPSGPDGALYQDLAERSRRRDGPIYSRLPAVRSNP